MKLIWKGKFESIEQLPVTELPEDAVKFKEPETLVKLNLIASFFIIPVFVVITAAMLIKRSLNPGLEFPNLFNIWGLILAALMIVPHELLHAAAFPKSAEVQVWYSLKNMMAFVVSTCPTSKARFIFLSLLPNLVFGFIPLVIWIFVSSDYKILSETLFSFAAFSLLMGVGDYLNVFNATTQMPKNSITQISGFHSYWYMPKNPKSM